MKEMKIHYVNEWFHRNDLGTLRQVLFNIIPIYFKAVQPHMIDNYQNKIVKKHENTIIY